MEKIQARKEVLFWVISWRINAVQKGGTISIEDFFHNRDNCPVIDVRSPSEFATGHIPNAYNIPLFSDEERAIVGTKYVQDGLYNAVIEGLRVVGPKLSKFVETLKSITSKQDVIVYCWRGGMRSQSMAWLFNLANFNAFALDGGYKKYRKFAQSYFENPYKLIVLGGMTGSGKTELLKHLKNKGEQVIDLENLANHKGSAFGWIGQQKQPSTEHFENLLFEALLKIDPKIPTWIEDESKSIGSVFIPRQFFIRMSLCPTISVEVPAEIRIRRLVSDYTQCNPNDLILSIDKISKRLGGENTRRCTDFINSGHFEEAVAISLAYYDKAYRHGLINKTNPPIAVTLTDDIEMNIGQLLRQKEILE